MWEIQESAPDGTYRCSFCGKHQDEFAHFTRGPGGVCICGTCIDICREEIEKGEHIDFEQLRQILASRRGQEMD